jgi:hypothetical protein
MPLGAARLTLLAKSQVTAVAQRTAYTVTAVGNAQVDTAQSKFGGASAGFDGTDDFLDTNFRSSILTSTETIEFWYRPTTTSGAYGIMSQNTQGEGNGFQILYINGGIYVYKRALGSGDGLTGTGSITANTWHHIAVVNNAGTAALYIDGTLKQSKTWSGTDDDTDLRFGEGKGLASSLWNATRYDMNGHLDEIRISNNARYTAAFTAPTEPFVNDANTLLLLHTDGTDASTTFIDDNGTGRSAVGIIADDNAQIDNAQSKFGGTSAVFPSTAGWLQTGAVNAFAVSGDWTKEFWVYYNKSDADQYIHHNRGGYSSGSFYIYTPSSGNVRARFNDGGTSRDINTTFSTGQWYHYALVNNGGTITWYVNGSSVGTASWSSTINDPDKTLRWGGFSAGGSTDKFEGWIDEYRFSDTARYTTSFTPDATAFENDANTLLLAHMDGTDGDTDFFDDNGQTTP